MSERSFACLLWTDLVGVRRSRCIAGTVDRAPQSRVGAICFTLPCFEDVSVPGTALPHAGEYALVGDEDASKEGETYLVKGVRVYFADVLEMPIRWKGASNRDGCETAAMVCSRNILRKALQALREHDMNPESRLQLRVGFELEFVLIDAKSRQPVDHQVYATSHALFQQMDILREMVSKLEESHVEVLQFHAESAPGQYEIALGHSTPIRAADKVTLAKEIIKSVAIDRGLIASFLPKINGSTAGNGMHCHMSLTSCSEQRAVDQDPATLPEAPPVPVKFFMAGILHHLPALLPLTFSSPNSFRRAQPGCWAGVFQVWGVENRDAALRLIASSDGTPTEHFEVKTFDATANPYLGLAGLIYAGLDGMTAKRKLPPPCQTAPSEADGHARLPQDMNEAISRLEASTMLQTCLGPDFLQTVLALRRREQDALGGLSLEAQVRALLEVY